MRSNWKIIGVLMVSAMALAAHSQAPSKGAAKPAAKEGPGQVQHITLPQYSGEITPGPNVQVYEKDCLICHTARYVSMQPRFSKAVWQSEVKKMVDAYGAPIPEADQALIVEYLVAVKGVEASAASSSAPK
jgi:cytochrome c5